MAWYWPELATPQSAKTAVVNALGVSALFAVWSFYTALQTGLVTPRRSGRPWLSLILALAFAIIACGIRKMSRAAAIAGVVLWSGWIVVYMPGLIFLLLRGGDRFALIGVALDLVFLLFYIIAVRATLAYSRFRVAPLSGSPNATRV